MTQLTTLLATLVHNVAPEMKRMMPQEEWEESEESVWLKTLNLALFGRQPILYRLGIVFLGVIRKILSSSLQVLLVRGKYRVTRRTLEILKAATWQGVWHDARSQCNPMRRAWIRDTRAAVRFYVRRGSRSMAFRRDHPFLRFPEVLESILEYMARRDELMLKETILDRDILTHVRLWAELEPFLHRTCAFHCSLHTSLTGGTIPDDQIQIGRREPGVQSPGVWEMHRDIHGRGAAELPFYTFSSGVHSGTA
ncbi:hypothetical protein L1887_14837 [Cichorium endivia]|nr:hypothetical protein L1887_14837 [Cichorium endivia]